MGNEGMDNSEVYEELYGGFPHSYPLIKMQLYRLQEDDRLG